MYGLRRSLPCLAAGLVSAWSILLVSPVVVPGAAEDTRPVRIGVLAKRGAERCLEQWGPTAEYLTTEVPGHRFEIRPLRYSEVSPAVKRGEVEFILANPSLYIELEQVFGASRIATLHNLRLGRAYKSYAGVIFCKAGRKDIDGLAGLKGKNVMAVEQQSFGGWQMAWRELKERGIDPHRDFRSLRFGGTHDAVVYAVREAKADVGIVRTDTLERMAIEGKTNLREFKVIHEHGGGKVHLPFLHSTRAYPEWPLAKARHTSDELAQKVTVALLTMSPDTPAAKAAQCAGWVIPQNYQSVHECLKVLRIGPYRDYGKVTLRDVVRRYWPWLAGAAVVLVLACIVSAYVTRLNRALRHALAQRKQELVDRQRAEEALRESEERFTTFMDYLPVAVFIKDAESRNLYLNRYMREVFGAHDWLGKSAEELFPPEIARSMIDDDKTVLSEGYLVREETVPDKDGVKRIFQTQKFSIDPREGEKLLGGFALDITEQKRAEQTLRESEARFKAVFENMSSGVAVYEAVDGGRDFVLRNFNSAAERIEQVRREEVIGRRVTETFPGVQEFGLLDVFQRVWRTGTPEQHPLSVYRDKRIVGWRENYVGKLPSGEVVAVYDDVTGRKRAEAHLRKSEAMRAVTEKLAAIGRLAAGVAHEINNPLTGVLTFAHLLREKENMDPQDKEDLDLIIRETTRAGEIVRGLLDFAREGPTVKEPLDLNAVIRQTIRLLGNQKAFQKITIHENLLGDLPKVDADMNQLQQVLINLSLNACEAMPGGGRLTISTSAQDAAVLVKVTDTGCGIRKENLGQIFEPFFSTKPVGKGTGLGLSVSYGIVQQHGGALEVESEEGQGTTFTIILPCAGSQPPDRHDEKIDA